MSSRILYRLIICLCLPLAGTASAAMPPAQSVPSAVVGPAAMEIQPAAIIYFNDNSPIAREHAAIIQSMVREAGSNFKLSIKEYELAKEEDLAGQVEKIADGNIGLIVIIEPRDINTLT